MDVDNVGAPKLSEEERLMNQAIEQSLQVTSGDGNTTDNPSAIKREPGAYVQLDLNFYISYKPQTCWLKECGEHMLCQFFAANLLYDTITAKFRFKIYP